jgi:hypothetical protein
MNPIFLFEEGKNRNVFIKNVDTSSIAFSLRKINPSYNGNCIKVRRSNDNVEQNIGFVSNVLDQAALLSFVGSNNGFVTTWYDQSGNGRNATQTTNASQPIIVQSGVVFIKNSKPSIKFTTSTFMSFVNFSFPSGFSLVSVSAYEAGGTIYSGMFRVVPPSGNGVMMVGNGTYPGYDDFIFFTNGAKAAETQSVAQAITTTLRSVMMYNNGTRNAANSLLNIQGSSIGLADNTDGWGTYSTSGLNLGYNDAKANISISEIIIFSSDQSAYNTLNNANLRKFYSLY